MTPPVRTWPALALIAPIRFYQRFITPYTPATCRYYPTCSAYAVTALRTRGAIVGTALTVWRLLRCNPWSDGGIDHVPVTGWRSGERSGPAGSCHDETPARVPTGSEPEPGAPPAGDPADWSGAPPTRAPKTKIGRFAA